MPSTFILTKQLTLTAVIQTVLAVPPSVPAVTITMIHVVNTGGADVTVRVCYVPKGAAAGQANSALWDFVIPKNEFIEFGDGQILLPEETIQASSNTPNSVNIFAAATLI